jgi:arylsulfatase A-like enzyme
MNVIVICADTFRYDHLGFVGRQPVLTPNLDRLARESAVFEDYRLCSFPTLLNRIEVFTGRYSFPFVDWGPLPYRFPVLAEVFEHNGFTTGLVADNPHLIEEGFGFRRGFTSVRQVPGQMHHKFLPKSAPMIDIPCPRDKLDVSPKRLGRYRRNAWWYQQRGTNPTETVFRQAMEWLDTPREKFFLWVDSFDPHEPWDAPGRYLERYPWDDEGDRVIWPHYGKASRHYSGADLANMRSLYKAAVSQTDYWVGELMNRLDKEKLLESTAVIFCSDHGFYFGEHDLIGKMMKRGAERLTTIYEEVGHIPLLIRHPGNVGAGQTIPGLCQPPDLFATVLELAGIPTVEWAQGNSLAPRMQGRRGGQKFAVGGCHPRKNNVGCLTVWGEEWCLIYSPTAGLEGSELYHRPTDCAQSQNVIAANRSVAEHHFGLLCSWFEELGVPASRQQQLLLAAASGWREWVKERALKLRSRLAYEVKYRGYAQIQAGERCAKDEDSCRPIEFGEMKNVANRASSK